MLMRWKFPTLIIVWLTVQRFTIVSHADRDTIVVVGDNPYHNNIDDISDQQQQELPPEVTHHHPNKHSSSTGGGSDIPNHLIGVVESCSGWSLNKLPIVRSFLKDGTAECYRNIFVQFIPNRKPVLVLYSTVTTNHNPEDHHRSDDTDETTGGSSNSFANTNDNDAMKNNLVEVYRIPLHDYTSIEALQNLMWRWGFTKKSHVEQELVLQRTHELQYQERRQHHIQLEYYKWRNIYVNEFRSTVMGISAEEYQERTKFQRLTCHPSGPIPDMLNDQYDRINLHIAGADRDDRYQYAVRYLEHLAATTTTTTTSTTKL